MTNANAEYIAELSDSEIEYQIGEVIKELNGLDQYSLQWEAAAADLRDMFNERRARRAQGRN